MYVSPISSRFWFGRFTPAMRATQLPLPLLVTRIAADDHGRAVPLDHATAFAHGLDGRTDFHLGSAMPVGDSTAVEVIGAELDLDLVTRQDADVVLPHLPGDGREHGVALVELHPEHRARERFDDLAFHLDLLFLSRHSLVQGGLAHAHGKAARGRSS